MSNQIKLKRGLSSARTFTPAIGEPIWTTDTKRLYVGDGSTVGGVLVGSNDFLPIAGIDASKIISGTIDVARIPVLTTTLVTEGTNLYYTNTRVSDYLIGGISSILTSNLTASRALISNASGKIAVSSVTSTELGYVSGVTSALQTQIDNKRANTSPVSGSWWQGTPLITPGGVMEIGRYIDFHYASANTADYDARIDATNNELYLYSPIYSGGKKIFHEGNLTKTTLGLGNVENTTLSTWVGSSNITTIGTLSSGTVPWARLSDIPALSTTLFVNGSNVGVNGTSEQTLRTITIPANTISSTGILKVTVHGYLNLNATGSATFRVKLGGNTFFTFTKNYGDSDSEFELTLYISNLRGIYTGTSYNDGNGVGTQMLADRKSITTDFTISRDLVVTAQGSVAANGASLDHIIVERA